MFALFNKIPYKREIAAVLAFAVLIVQGWNSMVPELGHGPCIVDAANAAATCAADWSIKVPDTINALIVAFLGGGVVAGKHNDKAAIIAAVKS